MYQEPVDPAPPDAGDDKQFEQNRFDLIALLTTGLPFGLKVYHVVIGLLVLSAAALLVIGLTGREPRLQATVISGSGPVLVVDETLSIAWTANETFKVDAGVTPIQMEADAETVYETMRAALPSYLKQVSAYYNIKPAKSDAGWLLFTPPDNSAAISSLELRQWDDTTQTWYFVPATIDVQTGTLSAVLQTGTYALFEVQITTPFVSAVLEPGQTFDKSFTSATSLIFAAGISAEADGALNAEQVAWDTASSSDYTVLGVIRPASNEVLHTLLDDAGAMRSHAQNIRETMDALNLAGIVLDYGKLDENQSAAFNTLLTELDEEMRGSGRLIGVYVAPPVEDDTAWDTQGYDWVFLGNMVDFIVADAPGAPGDYYASGTVDRFLMWASQQMSRVKLHIATSARSSDVWAGQSHPIDTAYAISPLGMVSVQMEEGQAGINPQIGEPLYFELNGTAPNLRRDEFTGVYRYNILAADGEHTIWLVTANDVRNRLDWLATYNNGGLVLTDLFTTTDNANTLAAIQEFRAAQPSTLNPLLAIEWTVEDASGAQLTTAQTQPDTPLGWTPEDEGEYIVSAALIGEGVYDLGAEGVIVAGPNTGIVPAQEGLVVGAPDFTGEGTASTYIPEWLPPPVYPAGYAAAGNFALGGQVNHVINNPELMRLSGMTWVKFQLTWHPDTSPEVAAKQISQAQADGFKVLISIVGVEKYPTGINVPAFLDFLRGVAYHGPDAIEVWNEPNLDYEWPRGEISGTNYVRWILAPSYNAIKEVNPDVMVISAAPAPNGAFFGEGGCSQQGVGCDDWLFVQQMAQEGATNYMDCVGVHFNAGATAPSATTGHPADPGFQHYSWYFGSMVQLYSGTFGKPICFTELGYLSPEGYGDTPPRFSWAAGTSVQEQASWLAEAAAISRESGLVRLMVIWNVDFDYYGDDPMAGYAIVRPGGVCPACESLARVMP